MLVLNVVLALMFVLQVQFLCNLQYKITDLKRLLFGVAFLFFLPFHVSARMERPPAENVVGATSARGARHVFMRRAPHFDEAGATF